MRIAGVLIVLSAALCIAQRQKTSWRPEWDYRNEAERVNTRGCANLTLVLDNWKYAIMTQVKDLLLHDHNTVLPDYGRIQPLSEALRDLYKEFNSLKERLAELTTKFDGVEAFVDDVRLGRSPAPLRGEPRPPGSLPGEADGRLGFFVLVLKVKLPIIT
uniref:Si:ch73-127m5.3 n=1 Tax=Neolamprologus brichardi TaxID=32507 RepID=A0A3Q4IB02_NEOBR